MSRETHRVPSNSGCLLTVADVADRVGLSSQAIRRAINRGELRASMLCHRVRIAESDVERWIAESRCAARPRVEARRRTRSRKTGEGRPMAAAFSKLELRVEPQ
jgi:excisionase family DNA binding protein